MNLMSVSTTIYFCKTHCTDCSDFNELKEIISDIKIKNNRKGYIIGKFTLQTYAFVYQILMDFPESRFDYETLKTLDFFESIYRLINV